MNYNDNERSNRGRKFVLMLTLLHAASKTEYLMIYVCWLCCMQRVKQSI